MSSADGLQYPFHNIPSIVLNKKGDTALPAVTSSPDLEAYTELSAAADLSPHTRNYISFLPKPSSRELEVVDGDYQHPQRHLLTDKDFVSPTVRRFREKSAISPQTPNPKRKQTRKREPTYHEITKYDEEAMKYYIAGLSVVGLLIFYRFITRTRY